MLNRLILGLAAAALGAAGAGAAPTSRDQFSCEPISGLQQLLERPGLRWIIVGEQHGTNEMPAAFVDIVCHAATSKRPVVVAVERPEGEQAAIDAYMESDGGPKAIAALTASEMWHDKQMQDGRGSQAYLQMLDELRRLHHRGVVERVVAFQPWRPALEMAKYEETMAQILQSASSDPNQMVLAFVGNCHAARLPLCRDKPAAAYLPSSERLTINVDGSGGTVWNCIVLEGKLKCGSRGLGTAKPPHAPRIELMEDPKAHYDAVLLLGGPLSASPPAVAKMDEPTSP
ncbi:hypothetical protein G7077_06340 [Sphingomonas piscis]|uniref:Haem-binding uptake Tiki superfamily ChaN domain-containing protein n=1 Tax=Sphingomonas piscis TaxID=2714943 RepID=A0A6G7YPA2_9SPHN|nr:hypothetical protein [Sphingomonas piscis]QIK78570.1 hypothetical protein G7077_06340 [Sphingomonas piscis]